MSDEMEIGIEDAEPGRPYRVTFRDCCVGGWFVATLDEKVYDEQEPDFLNESRWDNGVTLTEHYSVVLVRA